MPAFVAPVGSCEHRLVSCRARYAALHNICNTAYRCNSYASRSAHIRCFVRSCGASSPGLVCAPLGSAYTCKRFDVACQSARQTNIRPRRQQVSMLSGRELAGAAFRSSEAALANLDVKRAAVWAGLCLVVFSLRSFFPVILGTFIVGYVANSVVRWVVRISGGRVPRRAVVAFFYVGVITAITTFSLGTVPTVVREGQYFVRTLQSENPYVIVANVMRRTLGDDLVTKLETLVVYSIEAPPLESSSPAARNAAASASLPRSLKPAVTTRIHRKHHVDSEWSPERSRRLGMLLQRSIRGYVAGTAALVTRLLSASTKVVVKALFSLVFSFMIMWDLPVILNGVRRLGGSASRVRYIYNELAPVFADFGSVVGKSFEAQGAIALVNTSLTTLGLALLSIPGIGFLSVVTLVCSFIPVAGVFLSTLPMLILALSEYGAMKAMGVLAMVVIVHLVEAYILNPQIYSAHLHLHPFFVLVVLYIAEHLYGIAGLLMAVPVAVYLLRSVVLGEAPGKGIARDSNTELHLPDYDDNPAEGAAR